MIDGSSHFRLVPHVNHNSMYAGKTMTQVDPQTYKKSIVSIAPNESPVNLFKVDFNKYPQVEFVEQTYAEFLTSGDCLFVPAFYWY